MLPGNTMLSAGSLGRTTSGVAAGAYGYSQFTQNGGGTHSTASSSRFVPSQFQYNGRVAAALLPSVLVLAGYGGGAVAAALAVRDWLAALPCCWMLRCCWGAAWVAVSMFPAGQAIPI